MTSPVHPALSITRRHFFKDCGIGVGKIALASLLTNAFGTRAAAAAATPMTPKSPHFKARRQTRDPPVHGRRPEPARPVRSQAGPGADCEGKPIPPSSHRQPALRFYSARRRRAGAAVQVRQARAVRRGVVRGAGRTWPTVVDDICIIKSVHTDQFNHAPAQIFLNTGFSQPGRPSMGSWVIYGLGAETSDLPAFVVMSTGSGISGGAANWSSGFLPTIYAGVPPPQPGRSDPERDQPAGRRRAAPARLARPGRRAQSPPAWEPSAIRKSPRASPPTRWPFGCKPPLRS